MCDWMDGLDISQTTIAARALLRMSGANNCSVSCICATSSPGSPPPLATADAAFAASDLGGPVILTLAGPVQAGTRACQQLRLIHGEIWPDVA